MSILKNFDMNELRLERARRAARGSVSLEDGLRQIAPEIEKLKVGETAKLDIPNFGNDDNATRKFTMSITAKTSNLTAKGGAWEGRFFDIASDGMGALYVQRGKDLTGKDIKVRAKRGARKSNTGNGDTAVDNSTGSTVTQH